MGGLSRLIADRVAEHLQTVVHDHANTIDLYLEERLKALRLILGEL